MTDSLPEYLRSYSALVQHVRAALADLNTTEKGERFANVVRRAIPITDLGREYDTPILNPRKSHDQGVDLVAEHPTKGPLLIQSKLFLDRADGLDSIFSKFIAFSRDPNYDQNQQGILKLNGDSFSYAIVTLSRLQGIIAAYEGKEYSTRRSYEEWKSGGRLHILDGDALIEILRSAYQKLIGRPEEFRITFDSPLVSHENVCFGVASDSELKRLYDEFGDALFFENIRDFLGVSRDKERKGRTTPNADIVRTLTNEPGQMLARNNGIVFGAEDVQQNPDNNRELLLKRGSLLNGCQTTMCLVNHATMPSNVLVKVVKTEDPWDVAKAANYQNYVADIDLDLARYLRPQLTRRAAAGTGVTLDVETSAFQVIDELYSRRVTYDETRLFFIGIFSRTPGNVHNAAYGDLLNDVIDGLYREDTYGEKVFEALFALQTMSAEGLQLAQERFTNDEYVPLFQRLFKEGKPAYRVYIGILALCGLLRTDISERNTSYEETLKGRRALVESIRAFAPEQKVRYSRYYRHATKAWMQYHIHAGRNQNDMLQQMYERSRRANFTQLYRSLLLSADDDDELRGLSQLS